MKRIVCFVVLAALCCLLCSCDPGSFSVDREHLNDVVSIELIEYVNPDQKHFITWVPNQYDQLVTFNLSNVKILETLPTEKTVEFLDDFSKTDILHTYYAYDSPKDICIRLNYTNGNFLIIWANYADNSYAGYIGEYSSDGTVLSFWGSFSALSYYVDLVNRYFTYNLT